MFINDFDIKIHLYGDEKNFGLVTIDDGRLSGVKEYDDKFFNKLPQASFPIKKVTPEKIGKVIETYIKTYLTEMNDQDYKDALYYLDISSIKDIEEELNQFIHFVLFCKNGKVFKEPEEKYVEISFIKILSFEGFFIKFNDSLKNDEIKKIMRMICFLIYGKNNKYLTQPAIKSIVNISGLTSLSLEESNYVDHIAVINALSEQRNITNGIDFNKSPYDIDFYNFAEYILDYGEGQKNFDDSKQYSSYLYFTNTEFMGMILSRLDYYVLSGEREIKSLHQKIYYDSPYVYYFMDAKKKKFENDYEFRYGIMKVKR